MNRPKRSISVEDIVASEYTRLMRRGEITKRSAVRLAIASVITDNLLGPGDLLPSESRLAKIIGVSLGTVQSAMGELQKYDVVTRRRGDGTRVASVSAYSGDVWHFRFLNKKTGRRMAITRVEVDMERTQGTGPWHAFFESDQDFIRIVRRLKLDTSVSVGSEMVLPYSMAPSLSDLHAAELKMLNIRQFLKERFGIRTAQASQHIETITPSDIECSRFDFEPGGLAFQISAEARTPSGKPVYFQRIIAPCDACSFAF